MPVFGRWEHRIVNRFRRPPSVPVRPPKVGGTRVPDQVLTIDFGRPHDFHFGGHGTGDRVFRGCVLLGFTTPADGDGNRVGGFGEWGHDRWLVLRRPDGRLAYVPRDGLTFIEESAPPEPRGDEVGR